jgi:thermitase
MKTNSHTFRLLAFSSLLLAACGASPKQENVNQNFSHTFSVELTQTDTISSIEQLFNAKVVVWQAGQYAVLGSNNEPRLQLAAAQRNVVVEANTKSFKAGGVQAAGLSTVWAGGLSTVWAGGLSTVWAGGLSTVWAGGLSTVWAGGTYSWLPENTNNWKQIRLQQAHSLAKNLGAGVKIAIIDTGVDVKHPALSQGLAPSNEWKDFVDNDATPQEIGTLGVGAYGHGTNVASIVRQIAPRATILPIRVLDTNGDGTILNVVAGIQWAVAKGAKVINLSLGSNTKSSTLEAALKAATNAGVFIVSSAGNENSKNVTFPAASSASGLAAWQQLSVTSVDQADLKSAFSNHANSVELSAPGEIIFGAAPNLRTTAWSGTSMAAPIASGALALALGQELVVPVQNLADVLTVRSTDIYSNGMNLDFKNQLGKGRIQLEEFLKNTIRY